MPLGNRPSAAVPATRKRKRRAWKFPTLRQIGGVLALLLGLAIYAGMVFTLLGDHRAETTVFGYVRGFVTGTVCCLCGIAWLKGQTFGE